MSEMIVRKGGEIKATKNGDTGYISGYLCLFGNQNTLDTDGEYFSTETDFGPQKSSVVMYHHGHDAVLKNAVLDYNASIGTDDVGVWIKSQMDLRDDYKRAVWELAKRGYLGWSAGTLPAHFETEPDGRIRKFYLGLDASLTPTPADIRNLAQTGDLSDVEKSTFVNLINLLNAGSEDAQVGETVADSEPEKADYTIVESEPEVNEMSEEQNINEEAAATPEKAEAPAKSDVNAEEMQRMIAEAVKSANADLRSMIQEQIDEAIQKDEPAVKAGFNINTNNAEPTREEQIAKGWEAFIRYNDHAEWRATAAKAALNEGTAGEGGYLVPQLYSNQLVTPINEGSYLRAAGANVIQVTGTDSFRVPTLTNSAAAVLTAEAASFDQKEPTFGEVEFIPYKYTRLSKASEEVLADSRIPVFDILTSDGVYGFIQAENAAFTTGTGSSQPQGVVTGASTGLTLAGTAAITGDEIIELYYSLAPEYQPRASWMMNSNTAAAVRQLKNGSGDYIWQPALSAGTPPTIMGRPVFINNSMADLGASNKPVLFGDLSFYWIADFAVDETGNSGIYVQRLNELYAASGQVGFRWFKRMDAHVMLSEAIKVAVNAAA